MYFNKELFLEEHSSMEALEVIEVLMELLNDVSKDYIDDKRVRGSLVDSGYAGYFNY